MDIFEAAYRVAHDFRPGGAVGLARQMGINPGTFLNQLNVNTESHGVSMSRALAMSVAAGDTRIAEAFCWTLGGMFVRRPACTGASDLELLTLVLKREQLAGEFARVVKHCYDDGRISQADWQAIEAAGLTYLSAFLELMYRFKGMRDE